MFHEEEPYAWKQRIVIEYDHFCEETGRRDEKEDSEEGQEASKFQDQGDLKKTQPFFKLRRNPGGNSQEKYPSKQYVQKQEDNSE